MNSDAELLAACRVERVTSSGPGGQHASRNATAIRLTHKETLVQAVCQDSRSQDQNRSGALKRLRLALVLELRGQSDPAWLVGRVRNKRLQLSRKAKDYHAVIAVLLDALAHHEGKLREAADSVGLSVNQLAKALCSDKQVRQTANRLRADWGCGAIKEP